MWSFGGGRWKRKRIIRHDSSICMCHLLATATKEDHMPSLKSSVDPLSSAISRLYLLSLGAAQGKRRAKIATYLIADSQDSITSTDDDASSLNYR